MSKTEFSENLIRKRKELRLSQQTIANKIGVKISRYQKWEEGKAEPCLTHCLKLIEVLEVDDMYLFLK